VTGIWGGIFAGIVVAIAMSLPLGVSSTVAATYLLRGRRHWVEVVVPYLMLAKYGTTVLAFPLLLLDHGGFGGSPVSWLSLPFFLTGLAITVWGVGHSWDWRLYPIMDCGLSTVWWLFLQPLSDGSFLFVPLGISVTLTIFVVYAYRRRWTWKEYLATLPALLLGKAEHDYGVAFLALIVYLSGLWFVRRMAKRRAKQSEARASAIETPTTAG
jgi:hypothetical protein